MEEIEKIKRKKKINDQDKQQPGTIQDLIRKYDLDNIKEDDYLDYLVNFLNRDLGDKEDSIDILNTQMADKEERVTNLENLWQSYSINNVDCNNYKKSGFYYFGTGCSNTPESLSWVRMLVLGASTSGDIIQIAVVIGSPQKTYVRSCSNGTWSGWTRLGVHVLNNVATYSRGDIDPNTTAEALILSSHANCPEGNVNFYYIKTFFYQGMSSSNNRSQIAVGYTTDKVYTRHYYNGTWSSWKEVGQNWGNSYEITDYTGNMNDLKTSGFYSISTSATSKPDTGDWYALVMVKNSTNIKQVAFKKDDNTMWVRQCYNGTWAAWTRILTEQVDGTWTPTINTLEGAVPTVSYTTRVGYYKRRGNMVYIRFFIKGAITALNGTNNYSMISGLPFNVKSDSLGDTGLQNGIIYNCTTSTSNLGIYPVGNTKYMRVQTSYGAGAAAWKVTPSGGNFQIGGSGWYEIL